MKREKGMTQRILVFDDEQDILELVQIMLEDAGYLVTIAQKDVAFETLAMNVLPDAIILDMLLSGKDGRIIARRWKSQEETRKIPILMLSAHPSAEQEALEAGADDFLAKPFEMDELLMKIAMLVNRDTQTSEAARA
jgi:DNA-binding response OmpR family regulator